MSPDAKKFFEHLSQRQIEGLRKSEVAEDLDYAVDPQQDSRRMCSMADLNKLHGSPETRIMGSAITATELPTVVVDSRGHVAIFDGQYRQQDPKLQGRRNAVYDFLPLQGLTRQNTATLRKRQIEFNRSADVANACGLPFRIAIPDHDLVRWAQQNLVMLNPKSDPLNITPGPQFEEAVLGGTHKDVLDYTSSRYGEVHHMPSNHANVGTFSRGRGPAIWMYRQHHKTTQTWGRGATQKIIQQTQRRQVQAGQGTAAQVDDIQSILKNPKFGSLYRKSIEQMLRRTQGTY